MAPAEHGGASADLGNHSLGLNKLAISVIVYVLLAGIQGVKLRLPSCLAKLVVPRIS